MYLIHERGDIYIYIVYIYISRSTAACIQIATLCWVCNTELLFTGTPASLSSLAQLALGTKAARIHNLKRYIMISWWDKMCHAGAKLTSTESRVIIMISSVKKTQQLGSHSVFYMVQGFENENRTRHDKHTISQERRWIPLEARSSHWRSLVTSWQWKPCK